LIETIPANQPRFDFDPISGECRGLLIEESRTNFLLRSEDFSLWTASNASVQSNVITAPDGNTTADKLVENSSTGNKEVNLGSITFTSGTSLTFSCFVKAGERNLFRLAATTGFFASATNAFFNLSNGTVSLIQGGITSASIIPYPNGWYRCVATMLPTSSGSGNVFITLVRSGTTSTYGGDGTSGIYIWGAQLEAGTFPTSYIPTTASTVTRSADNVEMTGTNFSSWYNQTEGTFFYNGTLPFITNDTVTRVPFGVSNGFNFSNSIYVAKTPTTLGLSFTVINNNVVQTTGSSLPNMTSSKFKIAVAVADKNIYSSGYGGAINKFSKSSATIPPATRLSLGKEPWNGSPLNPIIGCINKFAYYPKALSPAELQYLTQ
jgi:hypothetical protein